MKKRNVFVVILLALVAVTSIFVGNTYAKYISTAAGTSTVSVAKWDIAVNTVDMTNGEATLGTNLECVLSENAQVVNGKIAPGRTCTIDVAIDPTGTEVGIDYEVALGTVENQPANLVIGDMKYSTGGSSFNTTTNSTLTGNKGSIALPAGLNTAMGAAEKTFVRVTLEWPYETTEIATNDPEDTTNGLAGATISVPVTVTLTQKAA